jgi:NAD+ synthase (glutamine-hydrolysing)
MKLIRVGAAVLNQTPLDWDGNAARIRSAIQAAREAGVSLLCLPELCITGYGCEDAFHAPGTQQMAMQLLEELKLETRGMIVSFGLPLMVCGSLYNTACLVVDRSVLGFVAKQNLAGDGIHYEQRWFKPWPAGAHTDIAGPWGSYDVGDIVFDVKGIRIGFEICEDAWVADRSGADLASRGVDLILNPSASHFAFGKHEIRKRFVMEGSRAFSVGYIYANLLGNEAGRAIYDGDAMIAQAGKLLVTGPRFSYADWHITHALVDVDLIRMNRARSGSFRPNLSGHDRESLLYSDFDFPKISPTKETNSHPAWETSSHIKEEEFTRAVSLALFDYLRKSRSHGFVVSLSGGADSTAVSYLAARLVDFALADVGRDAFLKKLDYVRGLDQAADNKAIVKRLLSCAYQATRNSGDVTRSAARGVATALGAEYLEFDVDRVVQDYIGIVARSLGRELDWKTDDVALQNIQARARAPGIWMLANIRGALLLSTSNRSEAAVGYATMDGDTSGGLAPIAGIDKAFIRRWLRWCQTHGPEGIGPLVELAAINDQAPTAELRPPSAKQTDEDDLMPYELLDAVERAAIRDKMSPADILLVMEAEFSNYSRSQLVTWIERFFRLWSRNQWKRERYAPSFHLDDENLDPKTWCRFPILSGGYQRELADLRKLAEQS